MARVTQIGKVEFNRDKVQVGEIYAINFETFEVGTCDVVDIRECQSIDKSYYRVYFRDGTLQEIFNVSRVYWITKD